MNKASVKLILCILLICLNVAFIWGNSLLPADLSEKVSGKVMEIYERILMHPVFEKISVKLINLVNRILDTSIPNQNVGMHLLRKMAHFTEFLLLGLDLCWLFLILEQKGIHKLTMPMLFGSLTACVDETIQLFSDGRSSSLVDVWIDIAGLFAGIMILLIGHSILTMRRRKNKYYYGG